MSTVRIPCTKDWFQRVKNGEPDLRPINEYWTKRLIGKKIKTFTFTLGYPKADDADRHYVIPNFGIYHTSTHFVIKTKP